VEKLSELNIFKLEKRHYLPYYLSGYGLNGRVVKRKFPSLKREKKLFYLRKIKELRKF